MNDDWAVWRARTDLDAYDRRWQELADSGANPHGEADRVEGLLPPGGGTVLDAGCGTGRVAIELARRGHRVVGTDLDADMLDRARRKALLDALSALGSQSWMTGTDAQLFEGMDHQGIVFHVEDGLVREVM